ncbi:hypothetical protein FNH05_20195 [Amycolatopsis rhizosphaerae]|uniref:Cytochrome C biogenesis protein transmembrane domain-containing protein n=1 Tax=Amycolatopsis rhizosphaerae TaxID=2053003 RepID=A0A558CB98_9PSEU|nr:hypothetical protein FNH05_20195 [Amycolatopsis rhizosphaerae]
MFAALGGFLLTAVWSAPFADHVIGESVANGLLDHDAKETPIAGITAGVAFAFVTGLAGTFTACNIAVFSAMAPLAGGAGRRHRLGAVLRQLPWLGLGMAATSGAYGVIVGLVGTGMPQFDEASPAPGTLGGRLAQSAMVFGAIGLVMVYLGLAAVGIVRDLFDRRPYARLVFLGALVGAFLVGRPFPLFRALFRGVAESRDPLYGAAVFVLQSLGNVVVMAVLLLLTGILAGDRVGHWLTARPSRLATLTGAGLVTAGVFMVLYWDVRLLAMRGIIPWYPLAPWV